MNCIIIAGIIVVGIIVAGIIVAGIIVAGIIVVGIADVICFDFTNLCHFVEKLTRICLL
jgi:hypothetical protein